ncbi:hypothetical protein [Wielerella bovis]|uniref:hypothetical protein n=1 Tax=Wielerella bovis TaxID=2917790 RepID=UPI00201929AA|nr:hypothetical protein [Wielerella bovis]MCG7658040.1 hypothetical protein [Wielerella bovis]MCG7660262.1 hypothetical protein [Wielerella bovis]ULJ64701.1 hypothetical protein MIS33_11410 [Wielerella bovis]ULJ66973.1 hypothetical protein MIS31_12300 [Wielerella bovis]
MKKWFIISTILLTGQIYAAPLSAEELTRGKWVCRADYPNMHITTLDLYEYHADGSSKSTGSLVIDILDTLFTYRIETTGRWTLKDDVLTEVVHKEVTRKYSDKALTLIDINSAVADLENSFYDILSKNADTDAGNTISLKIKKIDDDTFAVQQLNTDGSELDMEGKCWRPEEVLAK